MSEKTNMGMVRRTYGNVYNEKPKHFPKEATVWWVNFAPTRRKFKWAWP
jgi:hypothetical protein